jgi:formylglycine-generating enzyme required for sulfatase activity
MPNHIFISYAREDQPYARGLADHLRQRDFDVWMDDRIDFGDRWWQTIIQALRASAALVVVMTPQSEKSEWVHREVLLALDDHKPVFPLLLRGERFPLLIDRQYADVTGGQMPPEDFYDRLRQALIAVRLRLEPEMVLIPAGEFLMGSDLRVDAHARDREQPQHTLYLPNFYLAKTPITNAQYGAFVQATFRKPPEHWPDGKVPEGRGNHPIVFVSWHDAVSYCRWLSEVTGESFRLPSEAEWEKGARGTDGRIYPWGNQWDRERCNSYEGGIGDTTPAGSYPQGASPYGVLDVAGNAWDWTRSLHRGYPYDPEDGREDPDANGQRVLRGGAFCDEAWRIRSAYRVRDVPDHRYKGYSFRVVSAIPPSVQSTPRIR